MGEKKKNLREVMHILERPIYKERVGCLNQNNCVNSK